MRHRATEPALAADRIERAAMRMGVLVDDLLLLARLDQQRPLEARPVDLLALAVDAVVEARVSAPDHSIELRVAGETDPVNNTGLANTGLANTDLANTGLADGDGLAGSVGSVGLAGGDDSPGVGAGAGAGGGDDPRGAPPVVHGDQAKLRQVIGNLLTNACQHTPPGTHVTVWVGTTGQYAVLEVADTGPGLLPEDAERVFERFYRVDAARNSASGGTGLGLSIVAGIVAAHGGTAGVRSAPGEGTRFFISLPLLDTSAVTHRDDQPRVGSDHLTTELVRPGPHPGENDSLTR
jgi:two-component system OmpR family sensor kinase